MALNERIRHSRGKRRNNESEVNKMAKFDMAKVVTDRVIEMLESGKIPWEKPWVGRNGAWSRATGKYYCLINQFLLPAGEYATMTQINAEGGKVNKGAKAKQVWSFYYKRIEETDEETGEVEVKFLPRQRYERVFNIAEDTTLDVKYDREVEPSGVEPLEALENIREDYVTRSGVGYAEVEGGTSAYYSPSFDKVVVPSKAQFNAVAEFYSTVFHELAHSTGHSSRLKRFEDNDTSACFGSEDYSREELVAELTACAVLANTGVETTSSFRNNAAYIQAWVNALKSDSKVLIKASAKAEAAYNLIMGIENDAEDESVDE